MINLNRAGSRRMHCHALTLGLVLLAAAASPAQAQTSVTMYGNLDVAIGKESGGAVVMGRGYNNWLGFKGQEDLGDGLAAIFNLQTRFIPGTGAQERPTTFFQGESTVGLKSSAGSLRIGRAVTPLWNNIWLFEPWYNSGFNGSLASYQTGSYSSDGISDAALGYANFARISNGVFYDSPDFSGFRFAVAGEVERNPLAKTRNLGISLNYGKGAAGAMVSYERNDNNDNIYFLGGSYGFGGLVIMGSYARTKLVGVNAAAAGRSSERLTVLAATYAVGADTIKAGYGRNQDSGSHKVSVGYSHPLSKRTTLYSDLYREKIKANVTGYAVGMSHTF
ncbi:porin [Collimonas humicola]|uniref:porin n=1 Tax=Collimonas humicola TaxID=2825886 RepID=UPI001E5D43BC|nr:porin [Collimonas humicola]